MSNDSFNKPPVNHPTDSSNPYAANPVEFDGIKKTSGKAITSLVLGLFSFLCSIFAGLPALILGILALGDISKSNGRLKGNGLAICGIIFGCFGSLTIVLVGLLLPAVQQVRTAARRTVSMNNIRQMSLAMLNHESAHLQLPTSRGSADGSGAGLSWRVHILPFIEQQGLYQQFHLDEPWDSPHNLTLVDQMPALYSSPNIDLPMGKTPYLVPTTPAKVLDFDAWTGIATIFVDTQPGTKFGDITDGSSNTILIVEANPEAAVTWTQPDDWEFDPDNPTRDLGGNWIGNQTIVGFADGSTHIIPTDGQAEQWKALFTRSGGEIINFDSMMR